MHRHIVQPQAPAHFKVVAGDAVQAFFDFYFFAQQRLCVAQGAKVLQLAHRDEFVGTGRVQAFNGGY